MQVKQIFAKNSLRNFIYLFVDEVSSQAICIDPYDADIVIDFLNAESLTLIEIWNTHSHPDHIRGNQKLLDYTNAKLMTPDAGEQRVLWNKNDVVECIGIPGHTMDHVGFYLHNAQGPFALLCGDTLFNAGVGHCRLGGEPMILGQTIQKLKDKININSVLYVGHDYFLTNLKFAQSVEPSNQNIKNWIEQREKEEQDKVFHNLTLKQELDINPFLRTDSVEIKKSLGLNNSSKHEEVFCELRKLRDNW